MDLLQSFKDYITRENLFSHKDKLLLAVSGGVDSVVLCELCHQAGFDFSIAHCNFRLRGEESERDESFVLAFAAKYGKQALVKHFDTQSYAAIHKISIQVAARELRYAWFQEIIEDRNNVESFDSTLSSNSNIKLLTAHHLDDNIETLLMNFFKGTGIAGLRAILPKQAHLVRPLLFAEKAALVQFATEHQLNWVEDSSNLSDKYTRNYFRHQLIPLVQQIYPTALHNLAGNITRFREIELLYRQSVDGHIKRLLEPKGNEIHIPVLKLKKMPALATLIYEIIQPFGFSARQVNEVIGLLDSGSGKYIQSNEFRILKNRSWLIISPLRTTEAANILIESPNDTIDFLQGSIKLEVLPNSGSLAELGNTNNNIAFLDADTIQFPLLLRKWSTGDYFYPLGMRKKKKLGRFFIDNKLSLADKEKVWVIEMNKKIIWIAGHRIDDRFRITPGTRNILKIESRLS